MDARDPAEAAEILDRLLTFFGEDERWIKGRFSDHHGKCCLVGALDLVSGRHGPGGEAGRAVSRGCPFRSEGPAR